MRVVRVRYQEKVFYASLVGQEVQCLNRELDFQTPIPLQDVTVLPPVAPTKVVCVGLNYQGHIEEMKAQTPDEPVLFFKPPSAVVGSGQAIFLPSQSSRVDYEGELAVVMGKSGRNIGLGEAAEHVFGYSCANDVTARDLQKIDGQYGRAKGFDTFAPIGPWIETEVEDPNNLALRTTVNGEEKQAGNTADMLFKPLDLVVFVSSVMTLLPGDVILTGAPPGVGPLHPGDEVRVEIENVGILINPVMKDMMGEEKPPIQ